MPSIIFFRCIIILLTNLLLCYNIGTTDINIISSKCTINIKEIFQDICLCIKYIIYKIIYNKEYFIKFTYLLKIISFNNSSLSNEKINVMYFYSMEQLICLKKCQLCPLKYKMEFLLTTH